VGVDGGGEKYKEARGRTEQEGEGGGEGERGEI
jgi:hypothetical protein